MFLPLVQLIGWGSLQASMEERQGISVCREALLLVFLTPLFDSYVPLNSALMMNKILTNGSDSQDVISKPIVGNTLIALYSGLPGVMQWVVF